MIVQKPAFVPLSDKARLVIWMHTHAGGCHIVASGRKQPNDHVSFKPT